VPEQVCGIRVDAVCACSFELIGAIATREQTDRQRSDAAGGEEIPHAVADH
jgi:hypothetical protein